jgi:MOSC domain-containing protein YiiM
MTITIARVQIARLVTEGDPQQRDLLSRQWTTGFYKLPVDGPLSLTRLGLVGDAVADTQHHGGPDKAVLCYAAAHYAFWQQRYPQLRFGAGGLGENLTLLGADEASVCIGDRYQIGQCEVEVSQPRQPCWKIARRWGIKTLTKEVSQTGRTGWYLRVIREGQLAAGQLLELTARPHPDWTVARANDLMFGRELDRAALLALMNLPELSEAWKRDLA